MKYITLNHITRSYLNQTQRPIHYYGRCLKFAADGLREQLFDTLKVTNTVRIPVDEFNEAAIPNDYIDWVKIGVQIGQFVRPLVTRPGLNKMANYDTSTGEQIVYPDPQTSDTWGNNIRWFGYNINTNGENTGGYYGIGAGGEADTFTIDEVRNVIKLNQDLTDGKIVLEYLGDGSFSNAATKITPYAQKTIEAYIDWQYKLHSKSFGAYDHQAAEREFYNELRKLRGRKNDITPEIVERIINRHRKASLK